MTTKNLNKKESAIAKKTQQPQRQRNVLGRREEIYVKNYF